MNKPEDVPIESFDEQVAANRILREDIVELGKAYSAIESQLKYEQDERSIALQALAETKQQLAALREGFELKIKCVDNVLDTYGIYSSHSTHDRVLALGQRLEAAEQKLAALQAAARAVVDSYPKTDYFGESLEDDWPALDALGLVLVEQLTPDAETLRRLADPNPETSDGKP